MVVSCLFEATKKALLNSRVFVKRLLLRVIPITFQPCILIADSIKIGDEGAQHNNDTVKCKKINRLVYPYHCIASKLHE
jgi:hypothetical protein